MTQLGACRSSELPPDSLVWKHLECTAQLHSCLSDWPAVRAPSNGRRHAARQGHSKTGSFGLGRGSCNIPIFTCGRLGPNEFLCTFAPRVMTSLQAFSIALSSLTRSQQYGWLNRFWLVSRSSNRIYSPGLGDRCDSSGFLAWKHGWMCLTTEDSFHTCQTHMHELSQQICPDWGHSGHLMGFKSRTNRQVHVHHGVHSQEQPSVSFVKEVAVLPVTNVVEKTACSVFSCTGPNYIHLNRFCCKFRTYLKLCLGCFSESENLVVLLGQNGHLAVSCLTPMPHNLGLPL